MLTPMIYRDAWGNSCGGDAVRLQGVHAQAAVELLVEVGSHEDALALALATDMSLATAVASRPEDDRLRQRHLWLAIARHVISQPASEVPPFSCLPGVCEEPITVSAPDPLQRQRGYGKIDIMCAGSEQREGG